MHYCLWLNGQKIHNAGQVADNFDIHSLKSYYYGGSLLKWLRTNGGCEVSDIIEQASVNDNIELVLSHAFGVPYVNEAADAKDCKTRLAEKKQSAYGRFNALSSKTSFDLFSFNLGSFSLLSYLNSHSLELYFGSSYSQISFLINEWVSFGGSYSHLSFLLNEWASLGGSYSQMSFLLNELALFGSFDDDRSKLITFISYISSCPLNMYGYGINII